MKNKVPMINIIIIALFNYVFLGTEYMYDNMMSYVINSNGVVNAQNYILGVSVAGFLLYPLLKRVYRKNNNMLLLRIFKICAVITGIICIAVIGVHSSYASIFISGCIFFVIMGIAGSVVHYSLAVNISNYSMPVSYAIGIAYALGILIQFIANNVVNNDLAESIMLCAGFIVLVYYGFGADSMADNRGRVADSRGSYVVYKNERAAGITLIIIVALMTCIFSTLDNTVTLVHAAGSVDIGQVPRVILAVSGLIAGYVFGIKNGVFINIIMYCVTLLSVMCVAVIELGGPFMIGLVAFYMSAGFFVVYFTTMFIQFSYNTDIPELWAGMGRAVNNAGAVITSFTSVLLLSSANTMIISVVALVLFALISVALYVYSTQLVISVKEPVRGGAAVNGTYSIDTDTVDREHIIDEIAAAQEQDMPVSGEPDVNNKLESFVQVYSLTEREKEVLQILTESDGNVSELASTLCMSRSALYRHISAINEKTNTSSRIGLIQFYYSWSEQ